MSARIWALGYLADLAYTVAAWAETTRDLTDDLNDFRETDHRWIR